MSLKDRFLRFPTPYTVLFVIIAFAVVATWFLPSGRYATVTYEAAEQELAISSPDGDRTLSATQENLEQLGLAIELENIESVAGRAISIPGTYFQVEENPQGPLVLFLAPILGIYEAIDIILFVLVIGGFIGVFNRSGAFDAGIGALAVKLRGNEGALILIVTVLMALGGTTYGMAEETLAFYPLLVPVFLAAGYDVMVPLAAIFIGSHVGFMASTTNPFATIIASDAAGVSWTAGLWGRMGMWVVATTVCILFILRYARRVKANPSASLVRTRGGTGDLGGPPPALISDAAEHAPPLTGRVKALLALFGLTFIVMIFGVSRLGWWFPEMTTLFLASAILVGLLQREGEAHIVEAFLEGARDLLGVAFIIGLARAVTVVLQRGDVSGTLLFYASNAVEGVPGVLFIVALLFVFGGLSIFIPSSSGMAVLTMPIMSSLAEVAGVPRVEIVNAYQYGIGIMFMISPSALLLPSLAMVDVDYDTWLKFVWPLIAMLVGLSIVVLGVGVMF